MSAPAPFTSVGVVGIGLLGGSILRTLATTNAAVSTIAYDSKESVRQRARQLGLATRVVDQVGEVAACDVVVVCVPASIVANIVVTLGPLMRPGAIITDVASVKSDLVNAVSNVLPPDFPFVPAHPMAGSEKSGPDAGFADLFKGKSCFLTPSATTPEWAVAKASSFWAGVGAKPEVMSAETHDRMVALTSHLPHLVAFALSETVQSGLEGVPSPLSFVGGGLRDSIRLSLSDSTIWHDIFALNKSPLLERLDLLETVLKQWRTAVAQVSEKDIYLHLTTAKTAAESWCVPPGREAPALASDP